MIPETTGDNTIVIKKEEDSEQEEEVISQKKLFKSIGQTYAVPEIDWESRSIA